MLRNTLSSPAYPPMHNPAPDSLSALLFAVTPVGTLPNLPTPPACVSKKQEHQEKNPSNETANNPYRVPARLFFSTVGWEAACLNTRTSLCVLSPFPGSWLTCIPRRISHRNDHRILVILEPMRLQTVYQLLSTSYCLPVHLPRMHLN